MTKLTKAQLADVNNLHNELSSAQEELEEAIEEFNDEMKLLWKKVSTAQGEYNQAVFSINEWRHGIAADIEEFIETHSDKWIEGERGQAYTEWKDSFEVELEECDLEQPDELEFSVGAGIELIDDDLQEEVSL